MGKVTVNLLLKQHFGSGDREHFFGRYILRLVLTIVVKYLSKEIVFLAQI